MEFVQDWGYLGMFVVAFVASTIVPASPEAVMLVLFAQGLDAVTLIIIGTIGGYLGSLTYYYLAIRGRQIVLNRFVTISDERMAKSEAWFARWGSIILFFSWLPFVGEPLLIVAGALKVRLSVFTFWVIVGRLIRFIGLLLLADPLIT